MIELPHTTHEIAGLLEALADDQQDIELARRLREWSEEVERRGQYQLRADAASIQSELYTTLEQHMGRIEGGVDSLRDVVHDMHLIVQSNQQRHETGEQERHDLAHKLVELATMTEQIRDHARHLAADLAARPSPEAVRGAIEQVAQHAARLDDHETRIGRLEGENDQEAST